MALKAPKSVWKNPVHFIAFGFGSGTVKFAPGTSGTLVGIIIYLGFQYLTPVTYAIATIAAFILGIWLCDQTGKAIGVEDHPGIVWDEIVGYLITMFMVPGGWYWILAGFVLFRFFDILKPPPINMLEKKFKGGLAVMADDAAAGIFSCIILNVAAIFIS